MVSLFLLASWAMVGVGQLLLWLLADLLIPVLGAIGSLVVRLLAASAELVGLSLGLPVLVIVGAVALLALGAGGLVAFLAWSVTVLLLTPAGPWLMVGLAATVGLALLLSRRREQVLAPAAPDGVLVGVSDWQME